MDIKDHLHPLKESTWTEIFPLLSFFDYSTIKGFGKASKSQNFREFRDDEKNNFELRAGNESQTQSNTGSPDMRSFVEKIAEFEDPQKALG